MLPAPGLLLGLPKFSRWFPGQEEIFKELVRWMESDVRFACAPIPTGFGKSLLGMLTGHWGDVRTAYITSTKGLQSQLMDDFEPAGLREIKGRGSYICIAHPTMYTDTAPCTYGAECAVRRDCHYFSALDIARESRLVNTNYSYWLYQNNHSDGISIAPSNVPPVGPGNPFGLLVLDEGHQAASAIESYMRVHLDERELEEFEPEGDSWEDWQAAASPVRYAATQERRELEM